MEFLMGFNKAALWTGDVSFAVHCLNSSMVAN